MAILLVVIMTLALSPLALASGEGIGFHKEGYPIVDEKITLRVLVGNDAFSPADFNDLELMQQIEEKTNVHIEWIMAGSGLAEKRALMLSTGDLPDMFASSVTANELVRYGANGSLIPMQDLIDEYAPNILSLFDEIPGLRAFVTAPDGNIYGVPRILSRPAARHNGLGMINKSWLDKLGLDMPTTVDEFHDVLLAFKTGDPNGNGIADEIPLTFCQVDPAYPTLSGKGGFTILMASFGVPIEPFYMDVVDGKVICTATLEGYKEGIRYISSLYADGLIDVEGFTMNRSQMNAKNSVEPSIVGYCQAWSIHDDFSNFDVALRDYAYMPLLKGPNGEDPVVFEHPLPNISRGAWVITSACENPEAAMRYIDYIYDRYVSISVGLGPIDVCWEENEDGRLVLKQPPEGMNSTQWKASLSPYNAAFAIPASSWENIIYSPLEANMNDFIKEQWDAYAKKGFPLVYYTQDESDEFALINTDLISLIERKASEWIMNGKIDEEWDAYLKELDAIGLQRLLEINQAAYDRYVEAME